MTNIKTRLNLQRLQHDLERNLNKAVKKHNEKFTASTIGAEGGEKMRILTETEKELLRLILSSDKEDYTYKGNYDIFPQYIEYQIKKLFAALESYGYAAKTYCWMGGAGWQVVLTPEGVNYFEKEEEYKKANERGKISIQTLNANGSNINFGNMNDSSFNINNTYNELEKSIELNAEEKDKEELKLILQELKDYVDNITNMQTVCKNTGLFKRIGIHLQKYQWLYQPLMTLLGGAIMKIMGGEK